MNKEKLQEKLRKAKDDYHKWINGKTPSDFNEFMRQSGEISDRIESLENRIRKLSGPVYINIPDYGDKMTIEDFKLNCEAGFFIDYDGSGNYATNDKMSDFPIYPSDVTENKMIDNSEYNFTHVIWFNK